MDRQIPRSIQYSDLRPEVIENQVKLIRFTPQTNIQNQVPNDVVRFQLLGNGFFDPYSSYIHMVVDFGEDKSNFAMFSTSDVSYTGVTMLKKYWDNLKKEINLTTGFWNASSMTFAKNQDYETGCRLGAGILSQQNIIYDPAEYGGFNAQLQIDADAYQPEFFWKLGDEADNTHAAGGNVVNSRGYHSVYLDTLSVIINATNNVKLVPLTSGQFDFNTDYFKNIGITDYGTFQAKQGGVAGYIPVNDPIGPEASLSKGYHSVPLPGAEFKILDRSAHSFINRLVIRSQGTEIERIEQYDVVAAMLNDLIYSNEQAQFHSFEGFGGAPYIQNDKYSSYVQISRATMAHSVQGPRGRVGERIWGWAFAAIDEPECDYSHNVEHTFDLTKYSNEKTTIGLQGLNDTISFISRTISTPTLWLETILQSHGPGLFGTIGNNGISVNPTNEIITVGSYQIPDETGLASYQGTGAYAAPFIQGTVGPYNYGRFRRNILEQIFVRNKYHPMAQFANKYSYDKQESVLDLVLVDGFTDSNVEFFRSGNYKMAALGQQVYEFIIPIYSGLIGVLMPEKKLIPMSLMPLEVDFTLNPHALITANSSGYGEKLTRMYTMRKMEIYSHVVFFEQEVHRSMESIVAEHGLFIHMNTFYMAPVTLHPTDDVTHNIAINLHFKNINSIHMVNMYTKYLTRTSVRKLHFCSHNLRSFQIRNGSDLIPSEPLSMQASTSGQFENSIQSGKMSRMFIELLKSYNKMHDPLCDTALDMGLSYQQDNYADTSSDVATDYDLNGTSVFSQNQYIGDQYLVRALTLNGKHVRRTLKTALEQPVGKYDFSQTDVQGSSYIKPDWEQVRGYLRACVTAGSLSFLGGACGVAARGAWGVNPNHISIRPNIFFIPTPSSKVGSQFQGYDVYGLSHRLLADKISRFSAMVGRCQYAISLEGINLGSNAQLLCGKRGMIPFDIMVTGTKSDKESSMSLVFAKCDFIVYIRPDLVVTVLGR